MTLLTAQLNNQDPTNPMDNAEITTQMAQLSMVSGVQQLNTTMSSMASQYASMQMAQGASLIGATVLTNSGTLPVVNGVGTGAISLNSNATDVQVQFTSASGSSLGSLDLGPMNAGTNSFSWTASQAGLTSANFTVKAVQGSTNVPATTMAQDTVTGVVNNGSTMNLQLQSGTTVPYSSLQAIM